MDTTVPAQAPVLPAVLASLREVVGPKGFIDDPADLGTYVSEERGRFVGTCAAVVRPASTEEVARVVGICAAAGVAITPQSGNTGLVAGGVPRGGIVLSTARLDRIRSVDTAERTMTVEAGVILADVQAAADDAGLLFPLSLAAEGSCRIGGNLATNAGGIAVLRYGNARELVLGLEVVLPDGRVWNGLSSLRKNNTGYDLKQLFLGCEGTLGIITAAVLKLFPRPRCVETALAAVPSIDAAIGLLERMHAVAGDALVAYELISGRAIDFCVRHIPGIVDPFALRHPWHVLIKLASPREGDPLREAIEETLAAAFEAELVTDAVIAQNEGQASGLWHLRESIPEAQKHEGDSIKNDVSVPLARMAEFVARADRAVALALPGIRPVTFGHLGDGNLHYNLSLPEAGDRQAFLAAWEEIEQRVCDIAVEVGGSFAAEHGIGELKRARLLRYKAPLEIELMRRLKAAIDPENLMNPGKVLPDLG